MNRSVKVLRQTSSVSASPASKIVLSELYLTTSGFIFTSEALNWTTGETVAIKQIHLADIPANELGDIMVCSRKNLVAKC